MEPNSAEIEEIARKFGFTEDEALAFYHLTRAQNLFTAIFDEPGRRTPAALVTKPHFTALIHVLGSRVLERAYPEGWSRSKQTPGTGTRQLRSDL